jgi:hypothetical protein
MIFTALYIVRTTMNRQDILAVVAVIVVVGGIGVGSGLAFGGSGLGGFDNPLADAEKPPALLHFESVGAQCTDDFVANSSTSVVADTNTKITYSQNVSLPGPSYAIGGPTFERMNESTYVLNVPIEETEKAPRTCSGVARYNGTMRIPAGEDPWQLIIKHDGERVTMLYGNSNRSAFGGSASVGQSVSGSENTSNSTTQPE